jgi:hypothetical protein
MQTQQSGLARGGRPAFMPPPISNSILVPRATERCLYWPQSSYWKNRDIFLEVQAMARRGFIPVTPAGNAPELTGVAWFPAGWAGYGFVVPGRQTLHVRLHHPNEGWFRLAMVDKWGMMTKGMLQNRIPTGNPEVSFINYGDNATAVYVIVDDPGWMSSKDNPFVLSVDRTWDPARIEVPALPTVLGIWAQAKAEVKSPVPSSAPSHP